MLWTAVFVTRREAVAWMDVSTRAERVVCEKVAVNTVDCEGFALPTPSLPVRS